MWKRKKVDDLQAQVTAPEPSYWTTHPEGAMPPVQGAPPTTELPARSGESPTQTGEFTLPLDQLPPDVAEALRAHPGGVTMSRTTVTSGGHTTTSTGLTRDGRPIDPNSTEGRALTEVLGKVAARNERKAGRPGRHRSG